MSISIRWSTMKADINGEKGGNGADQLNITHVKLHDLTLPLPICYPCLAQSWARMMSLEFRAG